MKQQAHDVYPVQEVVRRYVSVSMDEKLTVVFGACIPNFLLRNQEVTPCPDCNNATNKKSNSSSYAKIPWQFFRREDLRPQKPGKKEVMAGRFQNVRVKTDLENVDSFGSLGARGTN